MTLHVSTLFISSDVQCTMRRLNSPELWELRQLYSSGTGTGTNLSDASRQSNVIFESLETEEELDIELREDEPTFLAGQYKRDVNVTPVKIVKAPEGSMNRAALAGANLAKERRELRRQEVNEQADSEIHDYSAPWIDPMAQRTERIFAQDIKGLNKRPLVASQWRSSLSNKATMYGKMSELSVQEQRKSLPIYKLREQLLMAVREVRLLYSSYNIYSFS